MAKFCLIKEEVQKFKQAIKNGKINPFEMAEMSSEQRRNLLEGIVGKENAQQVNALFESKLLLKNKVQGYKTWVKKTSGLSKEAKRDLISRIERMDERILNPENEKAFLEDLAAQRLGVGVSEKEAKNIFTLSQKMQELKAKANSEGVFSSKDERLAYGWASSRMEDYINNLKIQSRKISFRERPIKAGLDLVGKVPGTLKSLLSSMDNSFFGRQGIKTLLDFKTSHLWIKNFAKSFGDIGKELIGKDAMEAIKADIYSRPNALNGKYRAGGYGLDVLSEEAFPSSIPARIPLLGRLYRASESAYNGGALRLRADLADRFIRIAEKQGVNVLNADEAKHLGSVISSLTGRGGLGKGEVLAREANLALFSIKFLKANIDTLIAPGKYVAKKTTGGFKNKGEEFAVKESAKSTLRVISSIAALLATAKFLDPDSVEEDPRSTNFGKIKVFGRWIDITGGISPIVTLAMRITPTQHNGRWGFWSKTREGKYVDLTGGQYGQQDALDTMENFFEGKASPGLRLVFDLWKGRTYSGERTDINKPLDTALILGKGVTVPITVQNFEDIMKDSSSSNVLASMILEGLGFSSSPETYPENWGGRTSKEMKEFKAQVGETKFKEANDKYNKEYANWLKNEIKSSEYKKLSDEDKAKTITKKKTEIKKKIFEQYNFE